jgi:methyl-accepting chemotaxis protein
VADAVRKLAERTAAATAEIDQTISAIQSETNQAVSAMSAVQPEVERGVALSDAAAAALHSIADGAKRTLGHIEHVASSTREQSIACHEIAARVELIARTVDDTAASTQVTAASTERLESISRELKSQLQHFRL